MLLCAGFVSSCGEWGLSSVVVHRLLTVVTSLVSKSHCGSQALQYGLSNYGTGLNCSMARDLDKKVNRAWTGHPHLRVINNHDDFDTKIHRVLKEISNVLEIPQPIEEVRTYIVEVTGQLPECIESEMTQTYLVADPDCEVRLRRRDWGGEVVNVHKTKKRISATEVLETERQVSNALYESLLQQADPYRSTIRKTRRSFIWKGQYFEIDTFHAPVSNLTILETKGVAEQENVNFPPFIKVVKDITGNKEYYNYNIALRR